MYITPFNLTPGEYRVMYEEVPPAELTIAFGLLCPPRCDRHKRDETLRKLNEAVDRLKEIERAEDWGFREFTWMDPETFLYPNWTVGDNHSEQQQWIKGCDGFYVQVGFLDPHRSCPGDPRLGLMHAMTLLDIAVIESGSEEPVDHGDKWLVDTGSGMEYSSIVGDLFRDRICIWNGVLAGFRSIFQVMCLARMLGRDPTDEWDRFHNMNGVYFTRYPELCLGIGKETKP